VGVRGSKHVAGMRDNRSVCRVFVGKPAEKKQLEDLSLGGRVILKLILKGWDSGGGDWINVASDICHWRSVVNSVMNHHVPGNAGNFPT
jgi:hypothetical protein